MRSLAGRRDPVFAYAGDEVVHLGAGRDLARLGDGDDTLTPTKGSDAATGGPGADRLDGGSGHDGSFGNPGDDTLLGGAGWDRLHGSAGDELAPRRRGRRRGQPAARETTSSSPTRDGHDGRRRRARRVLFALARADVPQPGADRVSGGAGDERIGVRDGEPDEVSCGAGFDPALLDPVDVNFRRRGRRQRRLRARHLPGPRPADSRAEDRVQSPREDARETP